MSKRKGWKKQFVVGENNKVKTAMYKPLFNFCIEYQMKLNQEAKKKGIKKRVPFIYAQVEVFKQLKKK